MQTTESTSRRHFITTSTSTVGSSIAALALVPAVHAAGSDLLKVGLIGCGGRGSGAATQALKADANVKLWAMADAFEDRLESSLKSLERSDDLAGKLDVTPERRFVGFEAYRDVIACCDVVLLCSPPHFRPIHLQAAVEAGKHVFAEKPCAVDSPGVRRVLATCAEAKRKGISVVSGLCLRYDNGFRETIQRIHDGEIGKIHTLQANDYRGEIWVKPRQPDWSDMTWQMRNWYYFTWLSGDFNVEQHVHLLDMCAWAMQDKYPVKAIGSGGRAVRTRPEHGHIFDHFSVTYEWASGEKLFANCRQQANCKGDISAYVTGSKGHAKLLERKGGKSIKTETGLWTFSGPENLHMQQEHDELFASIRSGKPINNGEYMANSTLLAIMGRMAAYTGQEVTWDMAMKSKEDLSPAKYDWNLSLSVPPVATPGITTYA
ncbi:MAG: Gfo/Idh/MocA family oxidoreductase [Pirellula sp.]